MTIVVAKLSLSSPLPSGSFRVAGRQGKNCMYVNINHAFCVCFDTALAIDLQLAHFLLSTNSPLTDGVSFWECWARAVAIRRACVCVSPVLFSPGLVSKSLN